MPEMPPTQTSGIDPIFVSVKQAAQALGISTWVCYQILDGKQEDGRVIESRYIGRRRLVSVASLREYANGLPTKEDQETA